MTAGVTSRDDGRWERRVAAADRISVLLGKGDLLAGRPAVDDVLPLLCSEPPHPVVAELINGWGVDGLPERLVVCCRAVSAIRRGELRPLRLARRLEDAVRDLGRDRRLVVDSPTVDRLAMTVVTEPSGNAVVESYVTSRVDTLQSVVGRPLPHDDRAVVENLLHATVDFASVVAGRLDPGDRALEVFGRPSSTTPASRRLLPYLRRHWPEVPEPTLASVHRLVRYRLLDPAHCPDTAGVTLVRRWRSCYPALHRSVALSIARHQEQRDYEASRRLRTRVMRGDWTALDAALGEPPTTPGLAA